MQKNLIHCSQTTSTNEIIFSCRNNASFERFRRTSTLPIEVEVLSYFAVLQVDPRCKVQHAIPASG